MRSVRNSSEARITVATSLAVLFSMTASACGAPATPASLSPAVQGSGALGGPRDTAELLSLGTSVPDGGEKPGRVEGIDFVVGEGSEATFTVREKLSRLRLPNDAVLRTTALTGVVRLNGRPSEIVIDLHSFQSDQAKRDR